MVFGQNEYVHRVLRSILSQKHLAGRLDVVSPQYLGFSIFYSDFLVSFG